MKAGADRANSYKRKSPGIDRRVLRAHRRSVEWKSLRTDKVNKSRNIVLSPFQEIVTDNGRNVGDKESGK